MKHNSKTVEHVSWAAYTGNFEVLEELLSTGDASNLFNGDLNEHVTNRTPLHMAALAGQTECVELLLEAKADPHMRECVPCGTDPVQGKTAVELARERGWDDAVELLESGMKAYKYGSYVPVGPGNNAKQYGCFEPGTSPDKAESFIWRPGAAALQGLRPEDYGGALPVEDDDEDLGATTAAATAALKPLPIAMLFPGQGSQYIKMLSTVKDLPKVKEMLATAERVLGRNLGEICLEGPEDLLDEYENCQPAMLIAGLAGLYKLRTEKADAVERCQAMAGLSLGEYTALCAAGVFTLEDGLRLVMLHGEAMEAASALVQAAQVTVTGLEKMRLVDLCSEALKAEGGVCQISIEWFPRGFTVRGTLDAVLALERLVRAAGALHAEVMRVATAMHTPLLEPARERLDKALEEVLPRMKPPSCAVYMNGTAAPVKSHTNPKVIVTFLKLQLTSPVLWEQSVRAMINDGASEFYELGPSMKFKDMMKHINSRVSESTTCVQV
eukprot:CAMPEP_0179379524 /NCGR_PEP_ID=MMETSP0797-20121207/89882_1 /TAXON_ID=47934 /ORGANISM="Dinophysis acuminata, Strain DAEP01" /LENGTH=497 /DNA_ID=CAMNT_0021095603 /DNA_START=144 /DNA_END=1637 /DNA_ORIENTATION=+